MQHTEARLRTAFFSPFSSSSSSYAISTECERERERERVSETTRLNYMESEREKHKGVFEMREKKRTTEKEMKCNPHTKKHFCQYSGVSERKKETSLKKNGSNSTSLHGGC
jgi:hypothetical protein